jgi:antitoxin ParD1/3/4
MTMIKKSITVTVKQAQWIKSQISTGDFASDSEVLRDLIRKEQARNTEVEAIRAALIKAEGMGTTDQTPQEIMRILNRQNPSNSF